MEDCSVDQNEPNLKSKKFFAYLATMPLLCLVLAMEIYLNYLLVREGMDPVVSDELVKLQLYILGALSIVYIGGQAALDAVLGWVRGNGGKAPAVVVNNTPAASPEYRVGELPDNMVAPVTEEDHRR